MEKDGYRRFHWALSVVCTNLSASSLDVNLQVNSADIALTDVLRLALVRSTL